MKGRREVVWEGGFWGILLIQGREQDSGRKGGMKERWRRGEARAYQMTGLPPAGDDLSKKPLICAQSLHSALIRALWCQWLNTCSFRLQSRRQTTTDKRELVLTAARPHLLTYGCAAAVVTLCLAALQQHEKVNTTTACTCACLYLLENTV